MGDVPLFLHNNIIEFRHCADDLDWPFWRIIILT